MVGHNGGVSFATEDHKPTNATETERIEAAGGTVEFERVCGNLAVSRAVGDFTYKQSSDLPAARQQISAEPDMTVIERKVVPRERCTCRVGGRCTPLTPSPSAVRDSPRTSFSFWPATASGTLSATKRPTNTSSTTSRYYF